MPIHDWSRVDDNVYHHFHQRWTIALCDALNNSHLPSSYSALVEQHAAGLVPDVVALQRRSNGSPKSRPKGGVILADPPKTRHVFQLTRGILAARANRVVIRHRMGQAVCIAEITSPGKKSSRGALDAFLEKTLEFLSAGVNVLIVDLFPPSPRDPQGIHLAVADRLGMDDPFELPADQPFTLAAYVAGNLLAGLGTRAFVEPVGLHQKLPDMPAYLDADYHVPVPLESTYQAAWASCPADMRYLVEHGKLPDE